MILHICNTFTHYIKYHGVSTVLLVIIWIPKYSLSWPIYNGMGAWMIFGIAGYECWLTLYVMVCACSQLKPLHSHATSSVALHIRSGMKIFCIFTGDIILPSILTFENFFFLYMLFYTACSPFHVMNIVGDADDMAWFSSALLNDIVNRHVPVNSKFGNT